MMPGSFLNSPVMVEFAALKLTRLNTAPSSKPAYGAEAWLSKKARREPCSLALLTMSVDRLGSRTAD
ncbi:hypothetical protein D3C76_1493270 [compost metagenome]